MTAKKKPVEICVGRPDGTWYLVTRMAATEGIALFEVKSAIDRGEIDAAFCCVYYNPQDTDDAA